MAHLHLVLGIILVLGSHLAVTASVYCQSDSSKPARIEARPTNCETHIAILDIADHAAGPVGLIIIVGRLGRGEKSRELNQHRLYSARAYLTEYRAARSANTIVVAEGERTNGYGQIELYVGGKLHSVFAIVRNAGLSVGSCEPPELDSPEQRELRKKLYPWLYRNRTQKDSLVRGRAKR